MGAQTLDATLRPILAVLSLIVYSLVQMPGYMYLKAIHSEFGNLHRNGS
jgi:hypothetical protein